MVIGSSYIVMYFNLISLGYSFLEYLKYIFTHLPCLLFFIGLFLVILVLNRKDDRRDLHL